LEEGTARGAEMIAKFPDVIHVSGDVFRIITEDGLMWIRWNTNIREPQHGLWVLSDSVVTDMLEDGVIVIFPPHTSAKPLPPLQELPSIRG